MFDFFWEAESSQDLSPWSLLLCWERDKERKCPQSQITTSHLITHYCMQTKRHFCSSPGPPHWAVCTFPNFNTVGSTDQLDRASHYVRVYSRVAKLHKVLCCRYNPPGLRAKLWFCKPLKPVHCASITHLSIPNRKNNISGNTEHPLRVQGVDGSLLLAKAEMEKRHGGWSSLNYYCIFSPIFREA